MVNDKNETGIEQNIEPPAPEKVQPEAQKTSSKIKTVILLVLLVALLIGLVVLVKNKGAKQRLRPRDRVDERVSPLPSTQTPAPGAPTPAPVSGRTPLAMAFTKRPTRDQICQYPVIFTTAKNLQTQSGVFDSTLLDDAESCGTKVVIALNEKTENIVGVSGGIDLAKFREQISPFAGKIDPYVSRGVIMAHGVVDEPHDCGNDWAGVCPKASEVDQAGAISKEYWPTLPTAVNTTPTYLTKENYTWKYVDIIMFQYAFHKGDLETFVSSAVGHKNKGTFPKLSWALQAKSGGCDEFKECPMSPEQVELVSQTMCAQSEGEWIIFVSYDETFLTAEMLDAIEYIKQTCK